MKNNKIKVRSKVWLYPGTTAAWHFVTVPKKESEKITKEFGAMKRGWGSLPVSVQLGETNWNTSIFPDKRFGTYLLPLKAKVREAENVFAGDIISFSLIILP